MDKQSEIQNGELHNEIELAQPDVTVNGGKRKKNKMLTVNLHTKT